MIVVPLSLLTGCGDVLNSYGEICQLPSELKGYMESTISLMIEIPEVLHDSLKTYLELRPDWDQDRVMTAALSLFLIQNRGTDSYADPQAQRQASRIYLDSLFKRPIGSQN